MFAVLFHQIHKHKFYTTLEMILCIHVPVEISKNTFVTHHLKALVQNDMLLDQVVSAEH